MRQLHRNHTQLHDPKTVSFWNYLIRENATKNSPKESLRAFISMRSQGIRLDNLTYPFLFKSCSILKQGKHLHSDIIKHGLMTDIYINNTLVHFYGSCKKIKIARKVFDEMLVRDIVSWNSIINAYVENVRSCDCIKIFCKMRESGVEPNETTMVGLLSASAEMGNFVLGKWVHSQVMVAGLCINCELGTSFVNMYAKCGDICSARKMFCMMTVKNVWTWSAMILELAQHSFALEALNCFKQMARFGIKPNYVTFLGVLCACSHAQLVEDGIRFFHDMQYEYNIKPTMAHYGAMVDCFSRANRLKEAYSFAINMPIKPDAVIWRTLFSACNIHDVNDYIGVADKVRETLVELEPRRVGNNVMYANKCAEVGLWEKAELLRSGMREREGRKVAAESCIQIGSSMCRFVSGKNCEDFYDGVYALLDMLSLHMKMTMNDFLLSLG